MAETKKVRLLTAEEIECRISVVNEKGLSLLLFKDARVDQKILDETYTPFGWRRSHQAIDGNLYCTVEIWDESKKQWIGKQDVGTMSYSEKEKGQASDSFKRACFNWGIGRELYTAPFIWIPAAMAKVYPKGDRYASNEHFEVKSIAYNDNREIVSLEITDSKGQMVYSMQQGVKGAQSQKQGQGRSQNQNRKNLKQEQDTEQTQGQTQGLSQSRGRRPNQEPAQSLGEKPGQEPPITKAAEVVLMAELNRTGVALETVLNRYGLEDISQMTQETYGKAMSALKQTKPKTRAVNPADTAA
ncbi:MAG: hypothetical protein NC541_12275 [bacterium]|nr:hypothetical protein [bacterium]